MISKRWGRPFLLAGTLILLVAAYVWTFKSGSTLGFRIELSNSMFLLGLSLLVVSSVYVTRFFGYIQYFQKWFRPRTYQEMQETDTGDSGPDKEKRDPTLIFASLLLIVISVLITL